MRNLSSKAYGVGSKEQDRGGGQRARGRNHRAPAAGELVARSKHRAEALAYMPIYRISNVVQGFIPAGAECKKLINPIRRWMMDVECSMFIFESRVG